MNTTLLPYDSYVKHESRVIEQFLKSFPFRDLQPMQKESIKGILEYHARYSSYNTGDIVASRGGYGESALFVLSGSVNVVYDRKSENRIPDSGPGRKAPKWKTFFRSFAKLWTNPRLPEVRDYPRNGHSSLPWIGGAAHRVKRQLNAKEAQTILDKNEHSSFEAGEFIGGIPAVTRSAHNGIIIANGKGKLKVLEIRLPGLRRMYSLHPLFREIADDTYRKRRMNEVLNGNPLFKAMNEKEILEIKQEIRFESYGEVYSQKEVSFKLTQRSLENLRKEGFQKDIIKDVRPLLDQEFAEETKLVDAVKEKIGIEFTNEHKRIILKHTKKESIIIREGEPTNGFIVILNGFVRVAKEYGKGHRTIRYLRKGQAYGLEEIKHNMRSARNKQVPFQFTLLASGCVDIMIIPIGMMEKKVLCKLRDQDLATLPKDLFPSLDSDAQTDDKPSKNNNVSHEISDEMLEFIAEYDYTIGTSVMMINLDRCVRCDSCVIACAASHEGNPRFVRDGPRIGKYMVPNACHHCADPACMNSCPSGSIHRDVKGPVFLDERTCQTFLMCEYSCKWGNIREVPIRNSQGTVIMGDNKEPMVHPTKCDLCQEEIGGTICERACPYGALKRIDMTGDLEPLQRWMK